MNEHYNIIINYLPSFFFKQINIGVVHIDFALGDSQVSLVARNQVSQIEVVAYLGLDTFHLVVRIVVQASYQDFHTELVAYLGLDTFHLVVRMLVQASLLVMGEAYCLGNLVQSFENCCNEDRIED